MCEIYVLGEWGMCMDRGSTWNKHAGMCLVLVFKSSPVNPVEQMAFKFLCRSRFAELCPCSASPPPTPANHVQINVEPEMKAY